MEEPVEVDDAAWPLAVMVVPARLDAPAIMSMFRGMDWLFARGSRFALVVDTRALSRLPNAVERRLLVQELSNRDALEARFNVGNGIILTSMMARGVLTAIQWLRPTPVPQTFVATHAEGVAWCCGRLRAAGVELSPAAEALRARGREGG